MQVPATETASHFDRTAFKVVTRRFFATYLATDTTANLFLALDEQKTFCRMDRENIFPVSNKCGDKGARPSFSIM